MRTGSTDGSHTQTSCIENASIQGEDDPGSHRFDSLMVAFGGKRYEVLEITARQIEEGKQKLTSARDRKVDYVAIGFPHCSLNQLKELATLLKGRSVNKETTLWIHTNVAIKSLAKQLGYVQSIEEAGGCRHPGSMYDPGESRSLGIQDPGYKFSQNGFLRPRVKWFFCVVRERGTMH